MNTELTLTQERETKFPPLPAGYGPSVSAAMREYARAAVALNAQPQTNAARDVLAERKRQIEVEGRTPEHDDAHVNCSMAKAAARYALDAAGFSTYHHQFWLWPWEEAAWKPSDPRRNLVKAGALILAEIERLDRAAALLAGPEAA